MDFEDAVKFHGHACPGLAIGYRVAQRALQEFGLRARDEELVAIVENNSCAVDAIQLICGCTFSKGNLIFKDFGKHVYTFMKRPGPEAVRIAVRWEPPPDEPAVAKMWQRYAEGARSPEVTAAVQDIKNRRLQSVFDADETELLEVKKVVAEVPEPARIYQSLTCSSCGEKVMEPRTRIIDGKVICIPCSWEKGDRQEDTE